MLKYIKILIALSLINTAAIAADRKPAPPDAVKDTRIERDTTSEAPREPKDTVKIIPHHLLGRMIFNNASNQIINKRDIQTTNYSDFSEIMNRTMPALPMTLGAYGANNSVSVFGAMPNNISYKYNGRSLNDLEDLAFNPAEFSPEFFENAEILVGSDASVMSGASGAAINFQEMRYNTAKPYTRLWYLQSANNTISSDGVYSQNIAQGLNFTFGFRAMTSDGAYENSSLESWNVRAKLRYDLNDWSSVSLTENFSAHAIGLNGGMSESLSEDVFSTVTAIAVNRYLDEKRSRHDVTLTYSALPAKDSSSIILMGAYLTNKHQLTDFKDETSILKYDSSGIETRDDIVYGLYGQYEQKIWGDLQLNAGADINNSDVDKGFFNRGYSGLNYSGYGRLSIPFANNLALSGGLRYERLQSNNLLSFGAKLRYKYDDKTQFFIDASLTENAPNLTNNADKEKEQSWLGLVGAQGKFLGVDYNINTFGRIIVNPIYSVLSMDGERILELSQCDCEETIAAGLNIQTNVNLVSTLNWKTKLQATYTDTDNSTATVNFLPPLYLYTAIEYTYKIIKSELTGGLSISAVSPFSAMGYYPGKRRYYLSGTQSEFMYDGLNAYLIVKIGNAFVRINMDNLLDNGYYYVSMYPNYGRSFKLSFSWTFSNFHTH